MYSCYYKTHVSKASLIQDQLPLMDSMTSQLKGILREFLLGIYVNKSFCRNTYAGVSFFSFNNSLGANYRPKMLIPSYYYYGPYSLISGHNFVPIRCGHIQLKIIWRCEAHLTFSTGESALIPIVTIWSISNNNSLNANYRPKILKFSYYYYGLWSPIYLITIPFLFDVGLLGCQSIYVNR